MSYDPTIGRWMQQDPKQYADGPNGYEFERDSPSMRLDPAGTLSVPPGVMLSGVGALQNAIADGYAASTDPGIRGALNAASMMVESLHGPVDMQRGLYGQPTYYVRPEPPEEQSSTAPGRVKVCKGYVKGDPIFDRIPAHYFLIVDGVGYGKYANSHAGGPPDSSGGVGTIDTKGTVQAGDEGKYPPTDNPALVPAGMPYSIAEDPTVPINVDKLLADIQKDLGRRDLHYGVKTDDCEDWIKEKLYDAQELDDLSLWDILFNAYTPGVTYHGVQIGRR